MEMYKNKIDTGSDGNLMPIKMLKVLFPYTRITDLNKSIGRNLYYMPITTLHTTNGSMQVIIINTDIEIIL